MYRKSILLIIILIVSLALITGCIAANQSTAPDPSYLSMVAAMQENDWNMMGPTIFDMFFSPTPKLGQESELKASLRIPENQLSFNRAKLANAHAWAEFYWTDIHGSYLEARKSTLVPINEVLVSGQPTWQGDALKGFNSHLTFKLPKEGFWRISGILAEADTSDGNNILAAGGEWIAVDGGDSVIDRGDNLKNSSLAYLANFLYGRLDSKTLDEMQNTVILVLDIAKAPLAGEVVPVTCTITSLNDVADFSMNSQFEKRLTNNSRQHIPKTDLLTEGDLVWQGDLKAREPVVVSASIRFPETGDWIIAVEGNSRTNQLNRKGGYDDYIKLNISNNRSSFGWTDLPEGYKRNTSPFNFSCNW